MENQEQTGIAPEGQNTPNVQPNQPAQPIPDALKNVFGEVERVKQEEQVKLEKASQLIRSYKLTPEQYTAYTSKIDNFNPSSDKDLQLLEMQIKMEQISATQKQSSKALPLADVPASTTVQAGNGQGSSGKFVYQNVVISNPENIQKLKDYDEMEKHVKAQLIDIRNRRHLLQDSMEKHGMTNDPVQIAHVQQLKDIEVSNKYDDRLALIDKDRQRILFEEQASASSRYLADKTFMKYKT